MQLPYDHGHDGKVHNMQTRGTPIFNSTKAYRFMFIENAVSGQLYIGKAIIN